MSNNKKNKFSYTKFIFLVIEILLRHPAEIKIIQKPSILFAVIGALLFSVDSVLAAAPKLYSQPAYESPIRGEPDDLLLIPGYGFAADDTVVYRAISDTTLSLATPTSIPATSTATEGVAPIVSVANAPYSLTVKLPDQTVMRSGQSYALWVRNAQGQWSNGIRINDARPLWITPNYVYATAQVANLPRYLKVVGRNLQPAAGAITQVKLVGPTSFTLNAANDGDTNTTIEHYVAKVDLPTSLPTGSYIVRVSRDGVSWVTLAGQILMVQADPGAPTQVPITCPPDATGSTDHTACIVSAINTAASAATQNPAGATVIFGPGTWYLKNSSTSNGVNSSYGIVVPTGVNLQGAGAALTTVVEDANWNVPNAQGPIGPHPLFTLLGHNTVRGFRFEDHHIYVPSNYWSWMFQLGMNFSTNNSTPVTDIIFTQNIFDKPYYAITDGGLAIDRLYVTYNEFGAYREAMFHSGYRNIAGEKYHIDHSIIAYNTFKPGSHIREEYVTPSNSNPYWALEGAMVSELGASRWLDVSNNVVNGASTEYLYHDLDTSIYNYAWDRKGWRGAFFWHMNNNHEMMLVSQNSATCTGDKIGDGEAMAYDNNQNTFGYDEAPNVQKDATPNSITVNTPLKSQAYSDDYYGEHWIQVVQGPGLGQIRKIISYEIDPLGSSVTFVVVPAWDVIPQASSKVMVGRQFWQIYTVDNFVDHQSIGNNGPCQNTKTQNWPIQKNVGGGTIAYWAQVADSAIEGNQMLGTDGIRYQQQNGYGSSLQFFNEIRGNKIIGEYKWESACSWSGIYGSYAASPNFSAPVTGYGVSISHNVITQADGLRGGAITVPNSAESGPFPYNWKLVDNTLIYHNTITNSGSPPSFTLGCDIGEISNMGRIGINLWDAPEVKTVGDPGYYQYRAEVWRTVLYGNSCNTNVPMMDGGFDPRLNFKATSTVRVCPSGMNSNSCECSDVQPVDITLTATASSAKVAVGDTVSYTVPIINNGLSSATAVLLTMEPGQGINITGYSINPSNQGTCDLVSYSCQLNTLNGGQTVTVTITGTATALSVSTSAFSVTQKEPNSNVTHSGASVAVSVVEKADLSLSLTASADPVQLNDNVTYTIIVTNNGPATATGVTVTDNLGGASFVSMGSSTACSGAGSVNCAVGSIANGASVTLTIVAKPNNVGTLTNSASVTENELDPTISNNAASIDTTVVAVDLSINLIGNPTSVRVGEQVTYTITVINNGPSTASNVRVNDFKPVSMSVVSATANPGTCSVSDNVSCNLGNLTNGAQATVSIVMQTSSTGNFYNLVSVAANEDDSNPDDNSTSATTSVIASADLSITKTDSPDPVFAGQALSYTITVTNNGPSDATSVVMMDTLPSGVTFNSAIPTQGACVGNSTITCSFGNLPKAATATASISVTPRTLGVITNSASVSAAESDPNFANNAASSSTTVDPAADLSVVLVDTPDPVLLGQAVTYTTTVTNNGPSASNVIATGSLPTCTIGTLSSGASASCTATVTANSLTLPTQSMSANGNEFDPNTANNTATATTAVVAPDLTIAAVSGPSSGTTGASITTTTTASNIGNATAVASAVGLYLSNDAIITNADTRLGSRSIPSLTAAATSSGSTSVTLPTGLVTGLYYLGALADDTLLVTESNETNNAKTGNTIQINGVPKAPSNLSATVNSRSKITLNWIDNAIDESGFRIERSTDGMNFNQIDTVGINVKSYANSGLSRNTLYYYRVRAYNSRGNSAYSNTVSARTSP